MPDYDELWNEYAAAFNTMLENNHGGGWSRLDETEQEIAALWKLTADMYSGGFDSFFLNWGHTCYFYAMRGIKRITAANTGQKKQTVLIYISFLTQPIQKFLQDLKTMHV